MRKFCFSDECKTSFVIWMTKDGSEGALDKTHEEQRTELKLLRMNIHLTCTDYMGGLYGGP